MGAARTGAWAVVLALGPYGFAARADSCPAAAAARAKAAYERADYAAAMIATQNVERCAGGSPAELADALRWRAQALFASGNTPAAIAAFAWVATADPSYALDPFLSPKLHELFQQGRARARSEGLGVVRLLEELHGPGGERTVRAQVSGMDPPSRVEAIFSGGVRVPAQPEGPGTYRGTVPDRSSGSYYFRAVIAGRELVSPEGRLQAAPPALLAQPASAAPSNEKSVFLGVGGLLVTGAGAASLLHGNGIVSGLMQGEPRITSRAQLDGAVSDARTFQTLGVAAMGVGGAAAVAALGWSAWGKTVVVVPAAGGAEVVGSF